MWRNIAMDLTTWIGKYDTEIVIGLVLLAFAAVGVAVMNAFRAAHNSYQLNRLKHQVGEVDQEIKAVEHEVEEVEQHLDKVDQVIEDGASGPHVHPSEERLETIQFLKRERNHIDERINSYLESGGEEADHEDYFDRLYDEARERYDDVRKFLKPEQIKNIELVRQQAFDLKAKLFEEGMDSPEAGKLSDDYHGAIKHFFVAIRKEITDRYTELELESLHV